MPNLKLEIKKTVSNINIDISLNSQCTDGGVYIFLLNNIPLYIGEASIFLSRLSYHLQQLSMDMSYFGLKELVVNDPQITYKILESGYPYIGVKNGQKRSNDLNRKERESLEEKAIEKYRPLTQYPIWLSKEDIYNIFREYDKSRGKKYYKRRPDCILPETQRNKFVNTCFQTKEYLERYKEIIEKYSL